MPTFAEKMEKVLGAPPPAGWVRLVTADLKSWNGRFVVGLPGWWSGSRFALKFDDKRLLAPTDLLVDADPETLARCVPLALIDGGPELLVLDRDTGRVRLWQHETGALVDVADSLDDFLATLVDGKALKRQDAARRKAVAKAGSLAAALRPEITALQARADHDGVVARLAPALADVEPLGYTGDGGFDESTGLAALFDALGLALWHLGRRDEATRAFADAYRCGGADGDTTWLHTALALLARGQIDAARTFERRSQAADYLLDQVADAVMRTAADDLALDAGAWAAITAGLRAAPEDGPTQGLRAIVARVRPA